MVKNKSLSENNRKTKAAYKSAAQRQAERRARLKANTDQTSYKLYLQKQQVYAQRKHSLEKSKEELDIEQIKETERKALYHARKKEEKLLSEQDYIQAALVQSPQSYCSNSSLMKAVHRVSSRLPRSPRKKGHTCKLAHSGDSGDLSELYELFCKSLPKFPNSFNIPISREYRVIPMKNVKQPLQILQTKQCFKSILQKTCLVNGKMLSNLLTGTKCKSPYLPLYCGTGQRL